MESETLVKLARANINIMDIDGGHVLYEYQWRTPSGRPKWSKGVAYTATNNGEADYDKTAERIYQSVQSVRAELEG